MAKTANVGPPGFGGLAPYLDAAATTRDVAGELAGKANLTWHAKQIQNALGAVAETRKAGGSKEAEADILDGAASVAYSLVALAEGCVNAVVDVAKRHGLDVGELSAISGTDQIAGLKADLDAAEKAAAKAIGEAKALAAKAQHDLQTALSDLAAARTEADSLRSDLDKLKAKPAAPEPVPAPPPAKPTPPEPAPAAPQNPTPSK